MQSRTISLTKHTHARALSKQLCLETTSQTRHHLRSVQPACSSLPRHARPRQPAPSTETSAYSSSAWAPRFSNECPGEANSYPGEACPRRLLKPMVLGPEERADREGDRVDLSPTVYTRSRSDLRRQHRQLLF